MTLLSDRRRILFIFCINHTRYWTSLQLHWTRTRSILCVSCRVSRLVPWWSIVSAWVCTNTRFIFLQVVLNEHSSETWMGIIIMCGHSMLYACSLQEYSRYHWNYLFPSVHLMCVLCSRNRSCSYAITITTTKREFYNSESENFYYERAKNTTKLTTGGE